MYIDNYIDSRTVSKSLIEQYVIFALLLNSSCQPLKQTFTGTET